MYGKIKWKILNLNYITGMKRLLRKIFNMHKRRYYLMWSSFFNAYQVYEIKKESKRLIDGKCYHSPSWFKGWAITEDTDKIKLQTFESQFTNPRFKIK